MTGRQQLTAALVGVLGLTGIALLLPGRAGRWLVAKADELARELALAIEDALGVEGEGT